MKAALRPLAQQAIAHWKEHLPKMHKAMKAAGTLEQAALDAAERTLAEKAELEARGYPPEAAWEVVRERYLFRPEEPGNSPEAEDSVSYKLQVELNRIRSLNRQTT